MLAEGDYKLNGELIISSIRNRKILEWKLKHMFLHGGMKVLENYQIMTLLWKA